MSIPEGIENNGLNLAAGVTQARSYYSTWKDLLAECDKKLEPEDHVAALIVRNGDDLKRELDRLRRRHPDAARNFIIDLLYPALDHYERFTFFLIKVSKIDTITEVSMLWGLLYLVVKLSYEVQGMIEEVTGKLEKLGLELRSMHGHVQSMNDGYEDLASDVSRISTDMVLLWLDIISLYRNVTSEDRHETTLQGILRLFDTALPNICDAVLRIKELAKRAQRRLDLEVIQRLLRTQVTEDASEGHIPCFAVPIARNKNFVGRAKYLQDIEKILRPGSDEIGMRSVCLWAFGGMGKTQTALAYAYEQYTNLGKPGHADAVLWITASDRIALLRAVSKIVVDELRLPQSTPGADQENLVLFQTWLTQTKAKWLIIFDDVNDYAILSEFWPAANRGAILVTTRKHSIVTQPIDMDIELQHLTAEHGAGLIHILTGRKKRTVTGDKAALAISIMLGGHPLAINQMSAFMKYHSISYEEFLTEYARAPSQLHGEAVPGSAYLGYPHSLATVWQLSFKDLSEQAKRLLAFLSFLSPTSILPALFNDCNSILTARPGDFFETKRILMEAKGQLIDFALVRHDEDANALSLHLLVQEAALHRTSIAERQKAFNDAVRLILYKFQKRGSTPRADKFDEGLPYLLHIDSLAEHWQSSQSKAEPLEASLDLCNLLCNVSFFILDNDPFGMRYRLASATKKVYEQLTEDLKSEELWADVLSDLQYAVLRLGDFERALELAHEINNFRGIARVKDEFVLCATNSRLGLALDSAGRHDEAQKWLVAAIGVMTGDDEEVHRIQWRNHLNYARNRYSAGDFETAELHCRLSAEAARKFPRSWDVWAYIHETSASLYLRSGCYDKARQEASEAIALLGPNGTAATTSSLAGICAYRAAQVAIAQNRITDAIAHAEEARTLHRSFKATVTTLARSTRLLAKAYLLDGREELARQTMAEAQRLREKLDPGRTDLTDESEEAYEKLVDIIQR